MGLKSLLHEESLESLKTLEVVMVMSLGLDCTPALTLQRENALAVLRPALLGGSYHRVSAWLPRPLTATSLRLGESRLLNVGF